MLAPTPPPDLRLGVGLVVTDSSGRFLLHRRQQEGAWALPSGHVEAGESLPEAARRELAEEAGLHLGFQDPVALCDDPAFQIVPYEAGRPVHFVTALFAGTAEDTRLRPGNEAPAWEWFPRHRLPVPRLGYTDHWLAEAEAATSNSSPPVLIRPVAAPAGPARGRPKIGVLAVVRNGGRILMAKRRNDPQAGEWGFPGGHLHFGERLSEAAARELREETGIEASFGSVMALVELMPASGPPYLLAALEGRYRAGCATAGDDVSSVAWVDPGNLPFPLCENVDAVVRLAARGG